MTSMIAYAQNFVSFFISSLSGKELSKIKSIILFGSVARSENSKKSDVDLFIDVFEDEKKIEEKAKEAVENFYKSIFFEKYWKLLDVKNEFNIVVGVLDQWKELKTSIIAGGLILYKKYSEKIDGKNFVLVYWDKIKPESKRVWLSKIIYGYTYKKKKYDGMLEKYDGKKISSNCILVPIDNYPAIISKFKQAKIQFKHVHVSVL